MTHNFAHATDICLEINKHLTIHEGEPRIKSEAILEIQKLLEERFLEKEGIRFHHHPWCNFPHRDPNECKMCDSFFKRFPLDGCDSMEDLMTKYFPEAKVIYKE